MSHDTRNKNPKLEAVRGVILKKAAAIPDLRAIMFCKTREMTVALKNWMEDTPGLKELGAERLAGRGKSATAISG